MQILSLEEVISNNAQEIRDVRSNKYNMKMRRKDIEKYLRHERKLDKGYLLTMTD